MVINELLYWIHALILFFGWIPVFILIAMWCDREYWNGRNGIHINGHLVIFVTALYILLIGFFIFGEKQLDKQPWNHETYATEHIVALQDNNQMNGRFYSRRGYIGEHLYYQYMVDIGNGGYKANKVKADTTTLYYDDYNCRVEWCKKERHWLYFSETEKYNKIYVPEGSITDDYMIDLQ